MKNLKVYIVFFSLILAAACAKDNSDGGQQISQQLCPTGQTMTVNGCVATSSPTVVTGSLTFVSTTDQSNGNLQVSNYEKYLEKAMQICNRYSWVEGIYKCSNWSNATHSITIQAAGSTSNQIQVSFQSQFNYNGYFQTDVQGGILQTTGLAQNPLKLTFSATPINDNAGFELRASGPAYTESFASTILVRVDSGKLENSNFDAVVIYRYVTKDKTGQDKTTEFEIARGRFNRVQ